MRSLTAVFMLYNGLNCLKENELYRQYQMKFWEKKTGLLKIEKDSEKEEIRQKLVEQFGDKFFSFEQFVNSSLKDFFCEFFLNNLPYNFDVLKPMISDNLKLNDLFHFLRMDGIIETDRFENQIIGESEKKFRIVSGLTKSFELAQLAPQEASAQALEQ